MILIEENIYRQTAQTLRDAIASEQYFNGSIEFPCGPHHCQMKATLIVYRNPNGTIHELVPVWWEFHLTGLTGEIDTDFSWAELKKFLMY